MIKIDLKAARLPLMLYWAMLAVLLGIFAFFPKALVFSETQLDTYRSLFFYWSDFLCPLAAVFCIMLQLGNTLEKRSFELLCSLPEKSGVIERWLFTVFVLIFPAFLAGTLACWLIEAQKIFSFWDLLYLTGANLAFYSALSLFLMILFRQIFYALSIVCGLMFADLAVGYRFLSEYSTFLNISCQSNMQTVENNRQIYYAAALALLLISYIFVKTDMLKRLNKLR